MIRFVICDDNLNILDKFSSILENIFIKHNYDAEIGLKTSDIDELLDYIKRYDDEVMIIGGASVYKEMLEYSDKLILTEIDATHDADVYFPSFNKEEWDSKVVGEQEENNIKYKHLVYTRKNNKNN